jgi:hypothetical protein
MSEYKPREPVSGWAIGGLTFAATMLVLIGIFQVIAGLVAIFNDLDTSGWGWIHLIIGIAVILVGYFLYAGATWAGVTAIVLAMLSAVSNFFFIPYYPFWSILVIALAVWVIWALTRPGVLGAD